MKLFWNYDLDFPFNISYYHIPKERIILWKQNTKPWTKEHYVLDANNSNSSIAKCFEIKSENHFAHKTLPSTEKCRSFTWGVPAANTLPCAHL